MPTLIATAGAADANSFVTVAAADTYLDGRLAVTAWTGATADDKARALISATATLDTLAYVGKRTTDTQALAWPRTYALRPDPPYNAATDDIYFGTTEVPQRVKDATCVLAVAYLAGGTSSLTALDNDAGVVSKTVGPLSKTFDVATRAKGLQRIAGVMDLVGPLLDAGADAAGAITMVRV